MFHIILIFFVLVLFLYFLYSSYQGSKDQPFNDQKSYKTGYDHHISIERPGGYRELKLKSILNPTKGANVDLSQAYNAENKLNPGYLVISVKAIGINYADIAIRWGIYSSAKKYVGFPITPGFEFSGEVFDLSEQSKSFKKGDKVFGVTLFGGYSSKILVPEDQVFHIPSKLSMPEAAALPTIGFTAYYAIYLLFKLRNSISESPNIMVHSAAGGVGGMICQFAKLENARVLGIVGDTNKIDYAKKMGCDKVIDKSKEKLWVEAKKFSPIGYQAIFDANGVETLQQSYSHLASEGKLVVYGFHTMLPKNGIISAWNWVKMAWNLMRTPKFSPMELTSQNKSVMAFNLSFLFNRKDLIKQAMNDIIQWINDGQIQVPNITVYKFWEVTYAHFHIQSGKTTGKIILVFE